MDFLRSRKSLPAAAAILSLAATGCGKAKDALSEALGIGQLTGDEISAMKKEAGWDDEKLKNFVIKGGFKLLDNFRGDLGAKVDPIPFPVDIPDQANGKAPSLALLKKQEFVVGENKFTRFKIVAVAGYDGDQKAIALKDELNSYLDEDQRISKGAGNQAGEYLVVQGQGAGGLAYLTGKVTIKKNDGSEAPVGGAVMYTTTSPFVTTTGGTEGKFLLAVLDQGDTGGCKQGGFVNASKPDIAGMDGVKTAGTPASTQAEVPCIGLLDKYEGQVTSKAAQIKIDGAASKAKELFGKANTLVTDFLGGWKMGTLNLTFVAPPAPPAEKPIPPPAPVDPVADITPVTPVEPVDAQPDTPPPVTDPIIRGGEDGTQYNLGCDFLGIDAETGVAKSLIADPSKMDDYKTHKGWRFFGDVRITNEYATTLFGLSGDAAERFIDKQPGYCLLTTGNQLYRASVEAKNEAKFYAPKDDKVSEMWQKVKVPANATAIQMRVAFFSQEYPTFVGTQFNDAFYIKFDESPVMIAEGNLNALAGGDADTSVANCSSKGELELGGSHKCGEWENVTFEKKLHGELWGINRSNQSPPDLDSKFNCAGGSGHRCYAGMIQPRIICRPLDAATEVGKELTLRIGVTDIGDGFYDSALAVDSVAFSTVPDPCGDANRLTPEPESKVSRYQGG